MSHNLRNRLKFKEASTSNLNTTPVKSNINDDREYSPVYLACTQESLDSVDVLWDWNSPQSKTRTKRRPKRIISAQKSSPKLTLRKHTNSTNAHRTLESMRDELLAFQAEYEAERFIDAALDDSFNNNDQTREVSESPAVDQEKVDLSDLFDDSLEQDLLLVSQQVEEQYKESGVEAVTNAPVVVSKVPVVVKTHHTPIVSRTSKQQSPRTLTKSFSSSTFLDTPKRTGQQFKADDSFDVALEAFNDDFDFPEVKKESKQVQKSELPRDAGSSGSTKNNSPLSFCKPSGSALKFQRKSLSFGNSCVKKSNDDILREEIEKRRLEALAKLRSKKIATVLSDSDTSPIKCSPEEIEIKRQQARAKLEQKKQQELIERNRREALKKLESRRRQAGGKLSQVGN